MVRLLAGSASLQAVWLLRHDARRWTTIYAAVAFSCASPEVPRQDGKANVAYSVLPQQAPGQIDVIASFAPGVARTLVLDEGAGRFAHELAVQSGTGTRTTRMMGDQVAVPECERGCELRYTFDLYTAGQTIDDPAVAQTVDKTTLAPPSTWLLHPSKPHPQSSFTLAFQNHGGTELAWGCFSSAGTYQGSLEDLREPPYAAVGPLDRTTLDVPGGMIDLVLLGSTRLPTKQIDQLKRWVTRSAEVLVGFYGRFPTPQATVLLVLQPGDEIGNASAMGNGGASILVSVGADTPQKTLDDDWILIHEMFHLAFPGLSRRHHWAEEGMATYLEPIARAALGRKPASEVWREWLSQMHFGAPGSGEAGLDDTPTWGRTYWGGALFWFMVDQDIREHTGSRRSIRDGMRAVLDSGGNISKRWTIQRLLSTIDAAVETDSASRLYQAHGVQRGEVSIASLFRELGVRSDGVDVVFDEQAPRAEIRRRMVLDGSERPER